MNASVSFVVEEKDIYPYTYYRSNNGWKRETLLWETDKWRGYGYSGTGIMDDIERKIGVKIDTRSIDLKKYQVGSGCIYNDYGSNWHREDIERDFKPREVYTGYNALLMANPRTYNLHLEYEKYKKKDRMKVEVATHKITVFDCFNIVFQWEKGVVKVELNEFNGKSTTIYEKTWKEKKIEAIQDFSSQYRRLFDECAPDILPFMM